MAKGDDLAVKFGRLEERVNNNIKFFWAVVAFGGLWLAALSGFVININNNINKLPATLSSELIKESGKSANAGQIKEASRSIEMAVTLMKGARRNKVSAKAEYFKSVSSDLNSIQSSPLTDQSGRPVAGAEELMNGIDQAWVALASYKSSLQPVPPIPKDATTVTSSIPGPSFHLGGSTLLYVGPVGAILPFALGPNAANEPPYHCSGITLVTITPGAYEILDGVAWTNVTFVNVRIKDEGIAPFELHNVAFINCTFEIANNSKNGHLLGEYVALDWSTLSANQKPSS